MPCGSAPPVPKASPEAASESLLDQFKAAFEDCLYLLLARHRQAEEASREMQLRRLAERFKLPTVAAVEILYHSPERRRLQDVLTCIREGATLATAGRLIRPNDQHALKSPEELARLFSDDPESVRRTREVAGRCSFSLQELRYRYPLEPLPEGKTSSQHLRDRTFEGAARRLGKKFHGLIPQLRKELDLIRELEYEGYFLTMHEIVEYCRRQNILCQGRGVGRQLGGLLCPGDHQRGTPTPGGACSSSVFSPGRETSPPDIDLDIEHDRRGRGDPACVRNLWARPCRHGGQTWSVTGIGPPSGKWARALGIAATSLDRLAKLVSHDHWER